MHFRLYLCICETLATFKRRLKTQLFAVIPLIFPNCTHQILFCILTLKSVLEVILGYLLTF